VKTIHFNGDIAAYFILKIFIRQIVTSTVMTVIIEEIDHRKIPPVVFRISLLQDAMMYLSYEFVFSHFDAMFEHEQIFYQADTVDIF